MYIYSIECLKTDIFLYCNVGFLQINIGCLSVYMIYTIFEYIVYIYTVYEISKIPVLLNTSCYIFIILNRRRRRKEKYFYSENNK